MSLQKLLRSRGAHFRRDDTQKIILNTYNIDGTEFIAVDYDFQVTGKSLVFLTFPMKLHTYCDIVQNKCR